MFTTSRYASLETRKLARKMAQKNKEVYVARGKKTIDELAQLARKNGEAGITIIEEQKNKAAHIAVIQVDELGRWTWKGERLLNSTEKN